MSFPSTLSSFTNPLPSQFLNSPSHSSIESAQNNAISQLENVIGVEGAASTVGSLEYLIKSPASNGGGHVQGVTLGGTGQTFFTKGDILVAQNAGTLSKLAVGTDGQGLKADSSQQTGVAWGGTNTIPTVRVYNNASILTWVKPSVLSYIVVKVQAGGATGGAANVVNATGSGGGAGGYSERKIPASSLGATVRINIGGSVVGTVSAGVDGVYSGFGGYVSCVGGSAGTGGTGINSPGSGGGASLGDINIQGGDGGYSYRIATFAVAGGGGNTILGMGGGLNVADGSTAQDGPSGHLYGGGGAGPINTASGKVPGVGAQGIVIVEEY